MKQQRYEIQLEKKLFSTKIFHGLLFTSFRSPVKNPILFDIVFRMDPPPFSSSSVLPTVPNSFVTTLPAERFLRKWPERMYLTTKRFCSAKFYERV